MRVLLLVLVILVSVRDISEFSCYGFNILGIEYLNSLPSIFADEIFTKITSMQKNSIISANKLTIQLLCQTNITNLANKLIIQLFCLTSSINLANKLML